MRKVYRTKKKFLTYGISFLVILFAYILLTTFLNQNHSNNQIMKEFGFEGMSIEDLVIGLDSGEISKPNLKASITGTNLKLADGNKEALITIDNHKFYLSFAPYIDSTHPCVNHNLITCSGELANEMFTIKIINDKDEMIINETVQSMDNGFIGIWLPRNITGTLFVSYEGMTAIADITTYPNSNTCLTTPLKLK